MSEKYNKIINGYNEKNGDFVKLSEADQNISISYLTYCFEMKILQILRKIKQEIEKFSHRRGKTATIESISSIQNEIIYETTENVKLVINSIFMTINRGNISNSEINTLHTLYYDFDKSPPPVVLIQNPLFLETLICWLFQQNNSDKNEELEEELRNKAIELLAYATSTIERLYIDNDTADMLNDPRQDVRQTTYIITQTLDIIMPTNVHNIA